MEHICVSPIAFETADVLLIPTRSSKQKSKIEGCRRNRGHVTYRFFLPFPYYFTRGKERKVNIRILMNSPAIWNYFSLGGHTERYSSWLTLLIFQPVTLYLPALAFLFSANLLPIPSEAASYWRVRSIAWHPSVSSCTIHVSCTSAKDAWPYVAHRRTCYPERDSSLRICRFVERWRFSILMLL